MAEITNGEKYCSACGRKCTKLYGFVMQVRKDLMLDQGVKDEYDRVMEKYGQADFLFCWDCTAQAFGIQTMKEKEEAENPILTVDLKSNMTIADIERIKDAKDGDMIILDDPDSIKQVGCLSKGTVVDPNAETTIEEVVPEVDYRKRAKELGINSFQRKKDDVLKEIAEKENSNGVQKQEKVEA